MSQEIAERTDPTPAEVVVAQVRSEEFLAQVAMALPETVRPERFVRATVTALRENPEIAKYGQALLSPLLKAAQDGLVPDGREAALVAYTLRSGEVKVEYLPMIGGLRKIAAEHGWNLTTRVVYANDEFSHVLGSEERIVHVPAPPGVEKGALAAAYAIATHRDGRKPEIAVMTFEEIEKVRKTSKRADSGAWAEWPERMYEKTVGRYLFKRLALDTVDERVARVLAALDSEPANSAEALYGPQARASLTPGQPARADVDGTSAPSNDGGRQVEGAVTTGAEAVPSTPDGEPDFGAETAAEPAAEASDYQPPAGALDDEVQALTAAANLAGEFVIPVGKPKGKTIAQMASEPRGEGWLEWAMKTADHPACQQARAYARVYLPEAFQRAMAELQTRPQGEAG